MCSGRDGWQGGDGLKKVLITGGRGFLGRNLAVHLSQRADCEIAIFDREESIDDLNRALAEAEVIFHLAGVNRPKDPGEFHAVNTELTEQICQFLHENDRRPKIVFSSSIQAELDNPYGTSKKRAEETLSAWARESGARIRIYRLKNLFGKWCRPNYNSVTATFCHNIANHLPITVSDPAHKIELTYVDDVIHDFLRDIDQNRDEQQAGTDLPTHSLTLGDLAGRIQAFSEMSETLTLPDFSDSFNRALYATYLSYVPPHALKSHLSSKVDARGSLAEFIKQRAIGQIFVSRTKPGITRGNHYHHTKTEKFFVVEGDALIRMRAIEGSTIEEYRVNGENCQVIDIPPGVTHSLTNIGACDLVTLFWSSEIFNPDFPDTYFLSVDEQVPCTPSQMVNK